MLAVAGEVVTGIAAARIVARHTRQRGAQFARCVKAD
jgi:hypothetical protein